MTDDHVPPLLPRIIDLLALFIRAKPHKRTPSPRPVRPPSPDDAIWPPSQLTPMPLSDDERPFYADVPLDHRGSPHVRSQLASFVAERAAIDAGRMNLFSLDDDINARHFIARYERAGVGHLAESHRRKLAEFRAREAEAGRSFMPGNPYIAKDCDSEERLQRMYGSPAEDRTRIIQFYRRLAERNAAERRGLPSRFNRYEPI